jgi:hypothetical protein
MPGRPTATTAIVWPRPARRSIARQYRELLDAAGEARRTLVAAAVRRAADDQAALAALNHLADSFNLPPFTDDELADEQETGDE